MQHQLCLIQAVTGWQRYRDGRLNALQAQHATAGVAVKMRMTMAVMPDRFELGGALLARYPDSDALFHQPVECAIDRDPVVVRTAGGQIGNDLVVAQRLVTGQQAFQHRHPGARDAAVRGNRVLRRAERVRQRGGGRLVMIHQKGFASFYCNIVAFNRSV